MPWGYAAAAVGTVVAGSMASNAAGSAADAQTQASQQSIAEQKREFNQTQQNQAPFIQNGTAANNKLAYLLGIGTNNGGSSSDSRSLLTSDLKNEFPTWNAGGNDSIAGLLQYAPQILNDPSIQQASGYTPQTLADLQGYLSRAQAISQAPQTTSAQASSDPAYGSLLKSFSAQDLANDPVYNSGLQFGLNQGTGAINQRALQSGSYDSGATLKALTQYANDYGSTKANDAYNRFNTNQSNVFNRLSGIAGTGQQAVNQVQTAGTNEANQISNSLSDAGNARSAGIIGGSNAWGSALSGVNGVYQNYNSNQTLQQLLKQNQQPNYGANTNYVGDDPGAGYY